MCISGELLIEAYEARKEYEEESKNRILFLDIDGVINKVGSPVLINPEFVMNVSTLVHYKKLRVCISSSWRKDKGILPKIRFALRAAGFDAMFAEHRLPFDKTGMFNRVDYIASYIENHNIEYFIILDDVNYSWSRKCLHNNWFRVNPFTGFDREHLEKALSM